MTLLLELEVCCTYVYFPFIAAERCPDVLTFTLRLFRLWRNSAHSLSVQTLMADRCAEKVGIYRIARNVNEHIVRENTRHIQVRCSI